MKSAKKILLSCNNNLFPNLTPVVKHVHDVFTMLICEQSQPADEYTIKCSRCGYQSLIITILHHYIHINIIDISKTVILTHCKAHSIQNVGTG